MESICFVEQRSNMLLMVTFDMRLFCKRSSVRTNQKAGIVQLIIKSYEHLIPLFLQGSVCRPD